MNKINFNIIVLSSVIRRVFIIPLCNILFKISSIICIHRASSCNNINNNNNYYYLPAYFKWFIIHVLHINKLLYRVINLLLFFTDFHPVDFLGGNDYLRVIVIYYLLFST